MATRSSATSRRGPVFSSRWRRRSSETARQLVANGITTAYLALTISWEPGLRSLDNARRLIRALAHVEPELRVDMRVQLRWEVFALDAIADVEAWLNLTPRPVLAFNDHLGELLEDDRLAHKVPDYAARAGLDETAYEALVERVAARSGEKPAAMARLAAAGRPRGRRDVRARRTHAGRASAPSLARHQGV